MIYLERQVKEDQSKPAGDLRRGIKHNRAFGQILKQQNHVGQNLDTVELERGVHVGGLTRLDGSTVRRHVSELLPPVPDRNEQRIVIQGVDVLVLNPDGEV